mmetsp:Transcript_77782/g.219972  ORF Transcript_77782/g.219972 Transcript_77782/m.219972 type:complete len:243 (+) Transcript_77782:417-1145(+)
MGGSTMSGRPGRRKTRCPFWSRAAVARQSDTCAPCRANAGTRRRAQRPVAPSGRRRTGRCASPRRRAPRRSGAGGRSATCSGSCTLARCPSPAWSTRSTRGIASSRPSRRAGGGRCAPGGPSARTPTRAARSCASASSRAPCGPASTGPCRTRKTGCPPAAPWAAASPCEWCTPSSLCCRTNTRAPWPGRARGTRRTRSPAAARWSTACRSGMCTSRSTCSRRRRQARCRGRASCARRRPAP